MFKRFRHRRKDEAARLRYRETSLGLEDFIWPLFLVAGRNVRQEIKTMPGVYRLSADRAIGELHAQVKLGLRAVLLFGIPARKGIQQAWSNTGIVQRAIPLFRKEFPDLEIITDVCLCSFTRDGHCHIGNNDATCAILAKIALSHARAGAHTVAPSDMMDGRVHFIRKALSREGFRNTRIMSYAAKYASNYYGPFRDAASCAPQRGDRKTYQMDPANSAEAMQEIEADLDEGAQSVIVKPALSYLDIIAKARQRFSCEIVGYNVSGEYAMLRNAVQRKWARPEIVEETVLSIKRAGANRIISYFAPDLLAAIAERQRRCDT